MLFPAACSDCCPNRPAPGSQGGSCGSELDVWPPYLAGAQCPSIIVDLPKHYLEASPRLPPGFTAPRAWSFHWSVAAPVQPLSQGRVWELGLLTKAVKASRPRLTPRGDPDRQVPSRQGLAASLNTGPDDPGCILAPNQAPSSCRGACWRQTVLASWEQAASRTPAVRLHFHVNLLQQCM